MKKFIQLFFGQIPKKRSQFFALVWLSCAFLAAAASAQTHPNIVVILADDLGYGDVGFNGVLDIPTPNIDAIAANGVQCPAAYVTEPFCAPSRASILTGRYQQRYGYNDGPNEDSKNPNQGLPLTETLLPQILQPAGYVSAAFGKWHLGFEPNFYPLNRGFDDFIGFLFGKSNYYNATLLNGDQPFVESEYLTDYFTDQAVSFIDSHTTQPFFLYLAYNAPHAPYDVPPPEYVQRVSSITDPQRRTYAAMVVALDDGVGRVMQALQDNNLLTNTLVFFLSDNGAPFTANFDGTVQSNLPLRGYKLDMLEGGIRVPFAMQWTGQIPPGTIYSDMVSSLDIFATAAAVAGVSLPTDRQFDGLNILPFLEGTQASPDRNLYWRWFGFGDKGPLDAFNTIWAVRNGPYKLVVERAKDTLPPALYQLSRDISEHNDQAKKNPAEVAFLQGLYDQWSLISVPDLFQKDSDRHLLPLALAGDWNSYDINGTVAPWYFRDITAPNPGGTPDSYNWLQSTVHVASAGGDTTPGTHTFAIVANKDYSTQWGGATVQIDGPTDLPAHTAKSLGPLNTITFEDGYYYSMRVIDTNDQPRPHFDMQLGVMKTSAPPVTVSRTSQVPAQPAPSDPITVNIATSAPKSPEERIFVRYSNDWLITSQVIEAQGSGTSYSAVIPPQPANTSVYYSIITSTVDLTGYVTSGILDELTLEMTGDFNAVPPVLPAITQQPSDKTVTAGRKAKFVVAASGTPPLSYQWTKNGADIAGAIEASYTTPSTTTDDNGSIFAAKVGDSAGTTISDGAVLTVISN